MGDIYGYNDQLWKPIHEFEYSGKMEKFTLEPGKYLMICHGAKGGEGFRIPGAINYGGVAYGILNLKKKSDFFAVVGGNGENYKTNGVVAKGGYNGGGDGGAGHSSYPTSGAGGGGASDIRLSNDITEIIESTPNPESIPLPEEYQQVEYIQSNGSNYIDTGVVPKIGMTFIVDYFHDRYSNNYWFCGAVEKSYSKGIEGGYLSGLYKDMGFSYNPDSVTSRLIATAVIDEEIRECETTTFCVFARNISGSKEYGLQGTCYRITIKNGEETINDFIPCYRIDDGKVGMYDVVGNNFVTGENLNKGPNIDPSIITNFGQKTLHTRIIVAGGGGGAQQATNSQNGINDYSGYGGGAYGGYVSSYSSDVNNGKFASQTDGYSFGVGMTPNGKTGSPTSGAEGASGGGGGWYGGYSSGNSNLTYSSSNGGGGSGYVLTEKSHKPDHYMEDYDVEDYYLTDTFMNSIGAEEPKVVVCVPTVVYSEGDTIIFPCVGRTEKINLVMGKYRLRCWGGDGDPRYAIKSTARGGYAHGTLSLEEPVDVFVTVGGSGVCPGNYTEFASIHRPTISFNGGGQAGILTDIRSTFGGGASDIRIGEDDLLARVIVAGGAGGHGSAESDGSRFGGNGGGEKGNASSNSDYGTVPGPGTQTESPSNSSDNRVDGSFGKGGNGLYKDDGFGGAGGGGWYGGSGCIPDSSKDDDRGGCGGSGYVLTGDSNKPIDYKLDERYHLTDTVLTTGGNTLPIGMTKIEIEVMEALFVRILCNDKEGIKYFDKEMERWTLLLNQELSEEVFEEYGAFKMTNDVGLNDSYEVYVYDPYDNMGSVDFYVVPPTQTIRTVKYSPLTVSKLTVDADVDEDVVNFNVSSKRRGIAEDARIELTITANMTDIPSEDTKVYCVQAYTQGETTGYHKREPKIKTLDHIDLLPVGIGTRMPSRFKSYIGGFIEDGEAITAATTAVSCERNRSIYSCVLCNNKTVRFAKLNLITNRSTIIKDIPKASIGNTYFGDILVDDDYIYVTSSDNNNQRTIWRTSLKPDDLTVNAYSPGTSSDYCFNAFGKMEWYDDRTIIINHRKGFLLFDTKTLTWQEKRNDSTSNARESMAIGKKHALTIYQGNSTNMWICELETNTWTVSDTGYGISWPSSQTCCCYANGKFYLTQQNYLYIIDDETMTLVDTIVTPYSTLTPKSIDYADGILYVTIQNSSTLYMYDIANNRFSTTSLPFTINTFTASGWCRPVAFRGYLFVPNIRLFVINFVEYAKYNMGYKYDRMLFITNKEYEPEFTYDERFVTFTDSNMRVHPGYINVPLEDLDPEKCIKCSSMNKSQYNKFISLRFSEKQNGGDIDGE